MREADIKQSVSAVKSFSLYRQLGQKDFTADTDMYLICDPPLLDPLTRLISKRRV